MRKTSYYTDVNRKHYLKNMKLEKEAVKMVTAAVTAIICVAAVMTIAIIARPCPF